MKIRHYLILKDFLDHQLLMMIVVDRNGWIDHWDVNDDDDESLVVERCSLERIIEHELVVELNVIVELNSFHV
jgi:hypothetical protein